MLPDKFRNIFYRNSPVFLIVRGITYLVKLLKNRKKKKAPVFNDPEIQEIVSAVKETKESSDGASFMSDFKYPNNEIKGNNKKIPMDLTPRNMEILNRSIIISPYDSDLSHRNDLEFIGDSRITGRGIYRYVGNDFSKFDLPYEEIITLDNYPTYNDPYRNNSEYYSNLHQ